MQLQEACVQPRWAMSAAASCAGIIPGHAQLGDAPYSPAILLPLRWHTTFLGHVL
jgi:hypothetical protein